MPRSMPRIDEKAFLIEAVSQHKSGNLERARDLYRAILIQNPKHVDAMSRFGALALQIENYEKALEFIEEAIEIGPATAIMYINLGAALRNLERYEEAIVIYDRALTFEENRGDAYYNKGRALQAAERLEESCECYKQALAINDQDVDAWVNLGTVQHKLNDLDEALHSCEAAARIKPDTSAAYSNASAILFDKGLYEIAMVLIDKAIELSPDNVEYRYKFSIFMLLHGQLERGWTGFDLRYAVEEKAKAFRRAQPPPYWDGENIEDLKGKKILLWTEQGMGEEIIFAGLLSDIRKAGALCSVECSERLMPIFKRSFDGVEISDWGSHDETVAWADPPFDFQYPAFSMLKAFRPSIETLVTHAPYISSDLVLRNQLRKKYESLAQGKRIVGISWGSTGAHGATKSIDLNAWKPILTCENVFLVNIQYGDYAREIAEISAELGVEIFVDPDVDALGELDPAFAQIAALDLVVSISNSNVHIAGAMGIPTWLILPRGKGLLWFWFLDREDSPWYPSVRLFRQKSTPAPDQDWWPEVIDEVADALSDWVAEPLASRPDP